MLQKKSVVSSTTPRFRPYTILHEMRTLRSPIRLNNKTVMRYRAPVVVEYLDMETGEIMPAAVVLKHPEAWPEVRCSERMLQRDFILNSLRKEVREFALFLLRFKNERRGVTPGVNQIVHWYARLTGKRASNVRRYLEPLKQAGVIAGTSLLGPLFQVAGTRTKASEHLSEDMRAVSEFLVLIMKARNTLGTTVNRGTQIPAVTQPSPKCLALMAQVEELVARLTREGSLGPVLV